MVWSASEDGTLRQYDFREGASCPPVGSTNQECRHVLVSRRVFGFIFCLYLFPHANLVLILVGDRHPIFACLDHSF